MLKGNIKELKRAKGNDRVCEDKEQKGKAGQRRVCGSYYFDRKGRALRAGGEVH